MVLFQSRSVAYTAAVKMLIATRRYGSIWVYLICSPFVAVSVFDLPAAEPKKLISEDGFATL
jgi:hypothetical protein